MKFHECFLGKPSTWSKQQVLDSNVFEGVASLLLSEKSSKLISKSRSVRSMAYLEIWKSPSFEDLPSLLKKELRGQHNKLLPGLYVEAAIGSYTKSCEESKRKTGNTYGRRTARIQ